MIAFRFDTADSTQWVVLGAAVCALGLLFLRRKLEKKNPLPSRPHGSLSRERDLEQQMQGLMLEISEMSRQIGSQLDARAAKLQQLIQQADERISALNGARANGHEASLSSITPPLADDVPDARNAEVYSLSEQGQTPYQIAEKLKRPIGEVELILALRSRR